VDRLQAVYMDGNMDSVLVSRLEVVETGRRRRWSDAEKLRVVAESMAGSRLVAATARRHGISRWQLVTWRRQVLEGRLVGDADREPAFAAVMLAAETAPPVPVPAVTERQGFPPAAEPERVEIVLRSGRRLLISSGTDLDVLSRLVVMLERE
jgi:transposase